MHRAARGLGAHFRNRADHPGRPGAHPPRSECHPRAGCEAPGGAASRRAARPPVRVLPARRGAGRPRGRALHQLAGEGGHRPVPARNPGARHRRRTRHGRARPAARHRVRALPGPLAGPRHPSRVAPRGLRAELRVGRDPDAALRVLRSRLSDRGPPLGQPRPPSTRPTSANTPTGSKRRSSWSAFTSWPPSRSAS